MNTEKQFGLFNDNLEKFDPNLKKVFSECLARYDKKKEKHPEEEIKQWFLVEIITGLIENGDIDSEELGSSNENTYNNIRSKVEEMLTVCGLKYSFAGKLKSSLDIPAENIVKNPDRGAGRFVRESLNDGDK